MEERRKTIRRQADLALAQRVRELEHGNDRRSQDDSGHLRRRAIRHNCEVTISMKIGYAAGYTDTWSVDAVKIPGRLLDLSIGGAALFTKQRIETGQELHLDFKLSRGEESHLRAAVRWVKAVPEKQGFASGVEFLNVPAAEQKKVAAFLAGLDASLGL